MWVFWVTVGLFIATIFVLAPYMWVKTEVEAGLPNIKWMQDRVIVDRKKLRRILFIFFMGVMVIVLVLAALTFIVWAELFTVPILFAFLLTLVVAGPIAWGLIKLIAKARDRALEKVSTPKQSIKLPAPVPVAPVDASSPVAAREPKELKTCPVCQKKVIPENDKCPFCGKDLLDVKGG
jgi:hypothetical protein